MITINNNNDSMDMLALVMLAIEHELINSDFSSSHSSFSSFYCLAGQTASSYGVCEASDCIY